MHVHLSRQLEISLVANRYARLVSALLGHELAQLRCNGWLAGLTLLLEAGGQ